MNKMYEFKHPIAQKNNRMQGMATSLEHTFILSLFRQEIRGRLSVGFSVNLNDHALRRNPSNLSILAILRSEA